MLTINRSEHFLRQFRIKSSLCVKGHPETLTEHARANDQSRADPRQIRWEYETKTLFLRFRVSSQWLRAVVQGYGQAEII